MLIALSTGSQSPRVSILAPPSLARRTIRIPICATFPRSLHQPTERREKENDVHQSVLTLSPDHLPLSLSPLLPFSPLATLSSLLVFHPLLFSFFCSVGVTGDIRDFLDEHALPPPLPPPPLPVCSPVRLPGHHPVSSLCFILFFFKLRSYQTLWLGQTLSSVFLCRSTGAVEKGRGGRKGRRRERRKEREEERKYKYRPEACGISAMLQRNRDKCIRDGY